MIENPEFLSYVQKKFVGEIMGIEYWTHEGSFFGFATQKANAFFREAAIRENGLTFVDYGDLTIKEALMVLETTQYNDSQKMAVLKGVLNQYEVFKLGQNPYDCLFIASFVLFDKSENPNEYNLEYNREKISRWSEDYDTVKKLLRLTSYIFGKFLTEQELIMRSYTEIVEMIMTNSEARAQFLQGTSERFQRSVELLGLSGTSSLPVKSIEFQAKILRNISRLRP